MTDPRSKAVLEALYGIPIGEVARICRVSLKTAMRWKTGQTCPPKAALMVIAADLGCFDPAWRGWRLRNGQLISPDGIETIPEDVVALPFMRAQIAAYQAEHRRVQGMEEQPEPGSAGELLAERALRG